MELIGISIGLFFGALAGLVPGFHLATLLTVLLALGVANVLPPQALALAIVSGAGTTVFLRILPHTFQPTAQSQLTKADPAVRMAYRGQGLEAISLLTKATEWGMFFSIPLSIILLCGPIFGFSLGKIPAFITIGVILFWIGLTVSRASKKALTLVGILAAGIFGYIALHHPSLRDSEFALAPMLAGMFALPSAALILLETRQRTAAFPAQQPCQNPAIDQETELAITGGLIGCVTGFLAGLGAGSLVATVQNEEMSEAAYAFIQAVAESTNDLLAIGLVLALGLGRSGEAALLSNILPQSNLFTASALLIAMAIGLCFGKQLLAIVGERYARFVTRVDPKYFAIFAGGMALISSWLAAQWIGLGIALAGTLVALFIRQSRLPAQVGLACLACPVLFFQAGLVPILNHVFY